MPHVSDFVDNWYWIKTVLLRETDVVLFFSMTDAIMNVSDKDKSVISVEKSKDSTTKERRTLTRPQPDSLSPIKPPPETIKKEISVWVMNILQFYNCIILS